MSEESTNRKDAKRMIMYAVSVILGSSLSVVLATYLLGLSPIWLSIVLGAPLAILGASLGEAIFDSIVLTVVISVATLIFLTAGPDIAILRKIIVPIATGLSTGKLVAGFMYGL
ncbi:MAG: hypothetical protein JSV21_01315 [Nitrospirota bacterium]|nr:MAG: hypothetical protein JSV21_01315 [Nitrospirota bacterium]